MKAVIIDAYKSLSAVRVGEIPKPKVKRGDVMVQVKAASVNSGDERMRSLNFKGLPIPAWIIRPIMHMMLGFKKPRKTLGVALSGVIESIGDDVTNFKVGDEIYAMTGARFGAFAEYALLSADHCIAKKPTNASFLEAAALPFGGTTALSFLHKANVQDAKHVLICGSTGAVGVAAVQIAKHFGAEVSVLCGPDGITLSEKLGADHVYDYTTTTIDKIEGTFDVVFDTVGQTPKRQCTKILSEHGRYVSTMSMDSAKELTTDLETIKELYESGAIVDVIDSVYKLEGARNAFERVGTGQKNGSVVLEIN
jgi:NADPH:quinone reductase-like Zn-dependent oxidoreductase